MPLKKLNTAIARVIGAPEHDIASRARYLRQAGSLPSGPRGKHHPDPNPHDAATLLLACLATYPDKATTAVGVALPAMVLSASDNQFITFDRVPRANFTDWVADILAGKVQLASTTITDTTPLEDLLGITRIGITQDQRGRVIGWVEVCTEANRSECTTRIVPYAINGAALSLIQEAENNAYTRSASLGVDGIKEISTALE